MSELTFAPMDDREISDHRKLNEIIEHLRGVKLTIIGIRGYVSSGDGKVANRQILVGANPYNAKTKDLVKLLTLSPSCQFEGSDWIDGTVAKDGEKVREIADKAINGLLERPDFSEFHTRELTDEDMFHTAWMRVIQQIARPASNNQLGQINSYVEICTGVYQHVEMRDRFYIHGYEMSSQEVSPAIIVTPDTKRPLTKCQDKIKWDLGLMATKIRKLHLREDDTKIRLNGTELSILVSEQKIREVRAVKEAELAESKKAETEKKETATKK